MYVPTWFEEVGLIVIELDDIIMNDGAFVSESA
jgi:hypothetical protein